MSYCLLFCDLVAPIFILILALYHCYLNPRKLGEFCGQRCLGSLDTEIKDWTNRAMTQGTPPAAKSWKGQGMTSPLEPPDEANRGFETKETPLCQPSDADFGLLASRNKRK